MLKKDKPGMYAVIRIVLSGNRSSYFLWVAEPQHGWQTGISTFKSLSWELLSKTREGTRQNSTDTKKMGKTNLIFQFPLRVSCQPPVPSLSSRSPPPPVRRPNPKSHRKRALRSSLKGKKWTTKIYPTHWAKMFIKRKKSNESYPLLLIILVSISLASS